MQEPKIGSLRLEKEEKENENIFSTIRTPN
jgi:hypothetical protein